MRQNSVQTEETLTDSGFYWREGGGVQVLVSRALEDAGFVNGFSTRLGGVSDFPKDSLNLAGFDEDSAANILENRRRFLELFPENFELATTWQVHGSDVKTVLNERDIENSEEKFDALISTREKTLVGVKTADCVPVLIGDSRTGGFGAAHAGWRGTAGEIILRTVEQMRLEFGTKTEDLIAAIGPAASGRNYEIGQDVIDAFRGKFSDADKLFTETRAGHALIDLHLANRDQLVSAGVPAENISLAPFCTMERIDLFFSYRREKRVYGKTGRLLAVIGKN